MADPHSGRVMGGGSGVGVITAITISGCSLLFLVLLRSKLAQKEEPEFPGSLSSSTSSAEGIKMTMENKKKKKKKQVVRFAEDVVEPRDSGAEYRARLRLRRRSSVKPAAAACAVGAGEGGTKGPVLRPAEEAQERRRKPATCGGGGAVPANRRALYRGLTQYRSQMATLMLYHT